MEGLYVGLSICDPLLWEVTNVNFRLKGERGRGREPISRCVLLVLLLLHLPLSLSLRLPLFPLPACLPLPHFSVHCFDLFVIEKRWLIDCTTDRA